MGGIAVRGDVRVDHDAEIFGLGWVVAFFGGEFEGWGCEGFYCDGWLGFMVDLMVVGGCGSPRVLK